MRGRGRGRANWRSGAVSTPVESDPVDAPPANDEAPPSTDFYEENEPATDMQETDTEAKTEGGGEMETETDVTMQEGEEQQEGEQQQQQQQETRKRPWEKPGGRPDGIKVKRKKVPGAKDLKIRRYVQPKNAVMCLNELRPGVTYNTEQEGGVGQSFCISVEVPGAIDGQKYRGYGSSKQLAKQAAAEAALISFVKPPVSTAESHEEDKTPWATLASFAIYKLFNDWREGRVGMCPSPSQPYGAAIPPGLKAFLNQSLGTPATPGKDETPQAATFTEAISAHLGGRAPNAPTTDAKVGANGQDDDDNDVYEVDDDDEEESDESWEDDEEKEMDPEVQVEENEERESEQDKGCDEEEEELPKPKSKCLAGPSGKHEEFPIKSMSQDELQMWELMGFSSFHTTKGKKVEGNIPANPVKGKKEVYNSAEPAKVPNPAKQVPDSAANMHPVMVLHQMRPGLQYNVSQATRDSKPFFTVTADIDGREFFGEGTNVKKAKFFLARAAIMELYGVDSNFEVPA